MSRARWLTPSAPPENRFYSRRLLIPATAEFLGLVNGALLELCHEFNWEEHGDWTPEETAEYFLNMFQAYLHNENEPPDWEAPDDLDGQPEQLWYEDLADWIIQGFLAITFTPAAAIVYTATVPKLRIAIRTGNLGALFKVLINGVEVWTGDSYGPITDLIEQVFDMSAETEPYTVRIEHDGIGEGHGLTTAKLEVVRGKAVADMVATILRADPTGCGVQWSTDNGDTWDTVDLATCITGLANDAIIQAVNSGYLQRAGGQTGPQSPPEPDVCTSFHVKLSGKDKWLLPILVNTGDTVELSNPVGGWSDGSPAWYCPDGSSYLIGQCLTGNGAPLTGDPLETADHMQVIARIGEGDYVDPFTALYTIPAVTVDQQFVFQANDSDLSDNSGDIEFDVEFCSYGGWCELVDLTGTLPDWLTVIYGSHTANGIEPEKGNGYRPDNGGTAYGARAGLRYTFPTDADVTSITLNILWEMDGGQVDTAGVRNRSNGGEGNYTELGVLNGEHTYETTPNAHYEPEEYAEQIAGCGWAGSYPSVPFDCTILSVEICGTGVNPFEV